MTKRRMFKRAQSQGKPRVDPDHPILWGVLIHDGEEDHWLASGQRMAGVALTFDASEAAQQKGQELARLTGGELVPYLRLRDILSPELTLRLIRAAL